MNFHCTLDVSVIPEPGEQQGEARDALQLLLEAFGNDVGVTRGAHVGVLDDEGEVVPGVVTQELVWDDPNFDVDVSPPVHTESSAEPLDLIAQALNR